MGNNQGNIPINNVFIGSNEVTRIYKGNSKVWQQLVTTISPSSTIQNTIPFTLSFSNNETEATIYYKLGTGTQQTYTAPFLVNQDSAGVGSSYITVKYWSVSAYGTEAEKTITYNTRGAIPSIPIVTVTNGVNNVKLDWATTTNTLNYRIHRSTTSGVLGTSLASNLTVRTYTDNTAVSGTTYYYTVSAVNLWAITESAKATGVPTSPITYDWRYVKFQGYGDNTGTGTTRLVELKANNGATNYLLAKAPISGEAINAGGAVSRATDGIVSYVSNEYPIWWSGAGIPTLVYDMGALRTLTNLQVWMFSKVNDPRQTKFKLSVSRDNVTWRLVADYSANTVVQPEVAGFSFTAPSN